MIPTSYMRSSVLCRPSALQSWVVLPVTNFDYCFGDSNFSHTYLSRIPEEVLVRSHKYDISRYRVMPEYLP